MPLGSICCLISWTDAQVKLQKISQVLLHFFCGICCSPEPPGAWRGEFCPWGSGLCGRHTGGCCQLPKERGGNEEWREAGGGCCQQVPLFLDLLRLKVTHSPASWGTSFEVSFPSLPEARFRPCPCFSYVILWITVFVDNITPGTQRDKIKTTWIILLFFQNLSETSIFTAV